ncbi:tripartite tricarboxylate transporter TctB family protein [Xanthobacter oligotrophicus]|uniref:tripartite tricarboxylate transporter TctB family protein n=1 Tax=Xanthobacter oligotrophicus TaxID=2607286 RepID=UPI0011F342CD|nr:tripartite tricarboxylate transporter TctB family protein [Xanthobacter oligotrophicus]MCG5235597.1 tripartite tricarboxylate transporter TctB family protein [Xanthobacter oligotrophicus]
MSSETGHTGRSEKTVTNRTMDMVVALIFMGVSALVMSDSWRVGASWAADGPQAGYFPFYVGLIMFVASTVTLVQNIVTRHPDLTNFVDRTQLVSVMQVLIPTTIYVGLIFLLGIYLASAVFIAFFMGWLGKYSPAKIIPVAVGVPLALFVMFEIWFLVPLPKGPLETALGY